MTDGNKLEAEESFMNEELGVGGAEEDELRRRLRALPPELQQKMLEAQRRMGDVNERALAFVREKPLVAVGAAVIAGFLAGRLANRV